MALVTAYLLPAAPIAAGLPLAAGLADWVENLVLLRALDAYPRTVGGWATAAGIITTVKLTLVYASLLLMIAAVARRLLTGSRPTARSKFTRS